MTANGHKCLTSMLLRSVKPGLGFSCNLLDHNPVQLLMNFGGRWKDQQENPLSKVEVMSSLKTPGFVTSFKISKTLVLLLLLFI